MLFLKINSKKIKQPLRISAFISALLVAVALSPLYSHIASADPGDSVGPGYAADSYTPEQQAKAVSYYVALGGCIQNNMWGDIKGISAADNGNATPATWFDNNTATATVYPDGTKDCKDIAAPALSLWGWAGNNSQFLKDIGYTYNADKPEYNGTSDGNTRKARFEAAVQKKAYNQNFPGEPPISGAAWYTMYMKAFTGEPCKAKDLGIYPSLNGNSTYKSWVDSNHQENGQDSQAFVGGSISGTVTYKKITIVNAAGKTEVHGYAYLSSTSTFTEGGASSGDTSVHLYGWRNTGNTKTCNQLADDVSNNANGFADYREMNPGATVPGLGEQDNTGGGADDSGAQSSCAIDGIGWIVCPTVNFLASVTDGMFTFLADNFLKTDVKIVDTSSGTYSAWQVMRNIANIAFVIVFLVIIYSQLTSMGIGSYGIKKMLPRLIVAAILVNLSFFVCQLAVDLSNLLGYGVKSLFDSIGVQILSVDGKSLTAADVNGTGLDIWKSLGATVLVGVGGVIAYSALGSLVAILLTSLVVMFVIFLLLIVRQMLIILLVVIAPLAFVAFLLPNTEQYFKKWQKMFTTLLLLFPIIGVIFGASSLASTILKSTYSGTGDSIQQIVAAGILIIPLIIVPGLLKASLNGIGQIGAKINGTGGKFAGKAGTFGGKMQGAGAGFIAAKTAGNKKFGRAVGRLATGTALPGSKRTYSAMAAKYENEAAGDTISGWERDGTLAEPLTERDASGNKVLRRTPDNLAGIALSNPTSTKGQAAIRMMATRGDAVELGMVRNQLSDDQRIAFDRAVASQYGSLKAKDPRAVKPMSPQSWGEIKQVEMHALKDDAIEEGASQSAAFRQSLIDAVNDPEQQRQFTPNIRARYGGGGPAPAPAPTPPAPAPTAPTPPPPATPPSTPPVPPVAPPTP